MTRAALRACNAILRWTGDCGNGDDVTQGLGTDGQSDSGTVVCRFGIIPLLLVTLPVVAEI